MTDQAAPVVLAVDLGTSGMKAALVTMAFDTRFAVVLVNGTRAAVTASSVDDYFSGGSPISCRTTARVAASPAMFIPMGIPSTILSGAAMTIAPLGGS